MPTPTDGFRIVQTNHMVHLMHTELQAASFHLTVGSFTQGAAQTPPPCFPPPLELTSTGTETVGATVGYW